MPTLLSLVAPEVVRTFDAAIEDKVSTMTTLVISDWLSFTKGTIITDTV